MAKKKMSIRQQRELEKQKKLAKIKAKQATQDKENADSIAAAEGKKQAEAAAADNLQSEVKKLRTNKKSPVKAAGIKSVAHINSELTLINSFGKGSLAVPEQYFTANNQKQRLNENSNIDIKRNDDKRYYEVKNTNLRDLTAHSDFVDGTRYDLLRLKPSLEKLVFKKEFEDNIHIQICYAVFDIVKALTPHIFNAAYTINSLDRADGEKNDIVGFVLNYNVPYNKFGIGDDKKADKRIKFENYLNNSEENFIYFPDVFYKTQYDKKIKKPVLKLRSEEEIYNLLSAVNFCRNSIGHFCSPKPSKQFDSSHLFGENYRNYISQAVDELFNERVRETDKSFAANEENNFAVIVDVLKNNYGFEENENNINELACELYKFSVLKSNKNLGFNLRRLRECALEQGCISLPFDEKLLNTFKSKLYKIIDFITVYFLNDNPEIIDEIVGSMRTSVSDEEKQKLYNIFAKKVYGNDRLKKCIGGVVKHFENKSYANKKMKCAINIECLEKVKMSTEKISDFSKLIYLLTRFLDGKEINILLTSLISKFQDIESFNSNIKDLKKYGIDIQDADYTEEFKLFASSGKTAAELSYIKSISKMNNSITNANNNKIFKDALLTLGVQEKNVEDIYNNTYGKDSKEKVSAFINNNVVKSNRFKYIVKYVNPKYVHCIGSNVNIVKFVLGTMPQKQIESYYNGVYSNEGAVCGYKTQIEKLSEKISHISYEEFANIKNIDKNHKPTPEENIEREKKKSLITLYYTVVYLFVKNLVQINAQYVKGFYHLERDKVLYGEMNISDDESINKKFYDNHDKKYYDILTRFYTGLYKSDKIKTHRRSDCEKINQYIFKDINDKSYDNYDNLYKAYRNKVLHLEIIQKCGELVPTIGEINSYFEVYHNITQRLLCNKIKECKELKYFSYTENGDNNCVLTEKSYPYSKPVLRALNVPFGYNLSRYKNLSYEKIFYREQLYEQQKEKTKKIKNY